MRTRLLSERPDRQANRVDIEAEVVGETEMALKLSDGTVIEWVPKSQVEDNGDGTFSMPEWIAKEKELL